MTRLFETSYQSTAPTEALRAFHGKFLICYGLLKTLMTLTFLVEHSIDAILEIMRFCGDCAIFLIICLAILYIPQRFKTQLLSLITFEIL